MHQDTSATGPEDAFLLQAMVAGMSTDVFLAKGTCSAETSLATLGFHMF